MAAPGLGPETVTGLELSTRPRGTRRRGAAPLSAPTAARGLPSSRGQTRRAILGPTAALGPQCGTCGPSPRSLRFAPPPTILQQEGAVPAGPRKKFLKNPLTIKKTTNKPNSSKDTIKRLKTQTLGWRRGICDAHNSVSTHLNAFG